MKMNTGLSRPEPAAEEPDEMWILDLNPLTRIHVTDEYEYGYDPDREPREYWPGQTFVVTLMEVSSQYVVDAKLGCSNFDVNEFPGDATDTAAGMLCSTSYRGPKALLVPDRWEIMALGFHRSTPPIFHQPLFDSTYCCDENLPVFSGIHQWRRCLKAWEETMFCASWPYSSCDVQDSLDELVNLMNKRKLTPLEMVTPAECGRCLTRLKQMKKV